jgi:aryl-alcohol dehydrogenase-like predicted oxidoreductase
MRYKRLGRSGLKVSAVGLGGNTFGRFADEKQTARCIHAALDQGINFFDTADVYNNGVSEEYVGKALADRRERAIITSKVAMKTGEGPNDKGLSRAHIIDGVDASLRRLGTEYMDLLQVHQWDAETPIEETMRALDDLVRGGKVRYIGCSNFTAWQLVWSLWTSERHNLAAFVSVQPRYSLVDRAIEKELLPACQQFGAGIIPYSPLAGGVLTGKYEEGKEPPPGTRAHGNDRFGSQHGTHRNFEIARRCQQWAEARGHTVGELAIAWLVAHPEVASVIAGVTKPEQVEANAKAAVWELTPEEVSEVNGLTEQE